MKSSKMPVFNDVLVIKTFEVGALAYKNLQSLGIETFSNLLFKMVKSVALLMEYCRNTVFTNHHHISKYLTF